MTTFSKASALNFLAATKLLPLLLLLAFTAMAQAEFTYTTNNDSITITGNTNIPLDGVMVIPDTIDGYPVTSIANDAFSESAGLTSVTIPASVTSIGNSAFERCANLTSVTMGGNIVDIGEYAFANCGGLSSVTIPDSVISIGNSAFEQCVSLTSVTMGNSVTSIGAYAFVYCTGLTSVVIPVSVTSIGNSAFEQCASLTSVTIGSNVTDIGGYAFAYCTSLTRVIIPESVTSIANSTFEACSGLTDITIGSNVTSIGAYAFVNCTSLTSVTIPASVTVIETSAYEQCTSLTGVYFQGDSPTPTNNLFVFAGDDNGIVYYRPGTTGWGTLFDGLPTVLWLPTITSISVPVDATYVIGQSLDYTLHFTETVVVTGTPYLSLTIGSITANAAYVSGSGSSDLLFRYAVQVGDSDTDGVACASPIALNDGTIQNAGNYDSALTFSVPATPGVLVDAEPPHVLSITRLFPTAQLLRTNVAVFAVTFSEAVNDFGAERFIVSSVNGGTASGAVTSVTGGPVVYEVAVTVTGGAGDIRLDESDLFSDRSVIYWDPLLGSSALQFDGADNLFMTETVITSSIVTKILKLRPDGMVIQYASGAGVSGLSTPHGMVIDGDGNLYVGGTSKIFRFDTYGTVTQFASRVNGLKTLAINSERHLYAAVSGASIAFVTADNTTVAPPPTYASGFFSPLALACDSNDVLYVGDNGNNNGDPAFHIPGTIKRVMPDGSVTVVASSFQHPSGLAFDHQGNLYVTDSGSNTVSKVTSNGVVTIVASGFNRPASLAFDSADNLYVNNAGAFNIVKMSLSRTTDLAGNAEAGAPYTSGQLYTYDPNDAPTDLTLSNTSVGASASANAVVGTLSTSDANSSDIPAYALVPGVGDTNNALFVIVTNLLMVNVSPLPVGSYSVRLQTDDGNGGTFEKAFIITVVDDIAPTVLSIRRQAAAQQTVQTSEVVFEVTFSEDVLGVTTNSFVVASVGAGTTTGTPTTVSGGPQIFNVTVSLTGGRGEFRLDVVGLPAD